MEIRLFCKNEEKQVTTFLIIDNQNNETFLIIDLSTEDRTTRFKNELIADALDMLIDNPPKDWAELDNIIARIKRAGVVFI